jgi:hypothetical protein
VRAAGDERAADARRTRDATRRDANRTTIAKITRITLHTAAPPTSCFDV